MTDNFYDDIAETNPFENLMMQPDPERDDIFEGYGETDPFYNLFSLSESDELEEQVREDQFHDPEYD